VDPSGVGVRSLACPSLPSCSGSHCRLMVTKLVVEIESQGNCFTKLERRQMC
jgi:hypothetical protein